MKNVKDYQHFMSNVDKKYKQAIIQAAKDTGMNVVVDDYATCKSGYPMPDYIAVSTYDIHKDHTEFWNRFKELKNEMYKIILDS